MRNNPNLVVVYINAYAKSGQILSIISQGAETKFRDQSRAITLLRICEN